MITLQFKDTDGLVEFVRSLNGHGLTVDADDEDLREHLNQIKPDLERNPFTLIEQGIETAIAQSQSVDPDNER